MWGKRETCSSHGKIKYDRYDRDDRDESRSSKKIEPNEKRPTVTNTIFGGPSRGQSSNKRKALIYESQQEVNTSYIWLAAAITFTMKDYRGIHLPQNDVLVISSLIDNVRVKRVLIDERASTNILPLSTYLALGWERSQSKKCPTPLVGFSG